MTREEAIIILIGFKSNPLFNSTHIEAFDMAVSALQIEPCEDCISRKTALEYINSWRNMEKYYHPRSKCENIPFSEVVDLLKNVPTATIESTDKGI